MPFDFLPHQLWFLLDTLLADFVIGFVLFTSLSYAVLSGRLQKQRPAIMASSAVGLALASGLVWWESINGISLLNLGPVALGFLVLIIGVVIFSVFRQIGGSTPAGLLAVGGCLLIGWSMRLNLPVDPAWVGLITIIMIFAGMYMLMTKTKAGELFYSSQMPAANNNLDIEEQTRNFSKEISGELETVKNDLSKLNGDPQSARLLQSKIERIIPQSGLLTEKMANLREKAMLVKNGSIHKINQLSRVIEDTPVAERKRFNARIKDIYKEINFDKRIERLDNSVTTIEKRIRRILSRSIELLNTDDRQGLEKLLTRAKRLQDHNTKLIASIERSEKRLLKHTIKAMKNKKGDAQ